MRGACGSVALTFLLPMGALFAPAQADPLPLPTTLDNFFQRGTQPDTYGDQLVPFLSVNNCEFCHAIDDPPEYETPIYNRWAGSMMGNSAIDPLFHAALTIANQDAEFAGDMCLRCHAPVGWLEGRSSPADGSALINKDLEGVQCNFCHRMLDPVLNPNHSVPPTGDDIVRVALSNAGLLPIRPGGGNYVVDPLDSRRGPYPFDDGVTIEPPYAQENLHFPNSPPIIHSPFHTTGQFCGTCHDVSNPAYTKQPDGSFALNPLGYEHPTGDPYDMFPVERTFSEWMVSTYAAAGVDAEGVFGGDHPTGVMHTCQDCHMPDTNAHGCEYQDPPFYIRPDLPAHDFNGGNSWIPDVLLNLYGDSVYPQYLLDSKQRAIYMLQNAATLEITKDACNVNVHITNETGHKLPTGYTEGRRMWIEVEFLDANLSPVVVRGEYNGITADLTAADTKVYEALLGVDSVVGAATGLPVGPSFHFALNNKCYKDNRIPPRGFTNSAFEAIGAAPVAAVYTDGQHWDDTSFRIPPGAASATVTVYYQTAAKEYIEFLRDENHTDDAGDVIYEQWELTGKSPPVQMRQATVLNLTAGMFGDADCSEHVDLLDHALLFECVSGPSERLMLGCEALDAELNGTSDLRDFAEFQRVIGLP